MCFSNSLPSTNCGLHITRAGDVFIDNADEEQTESWKLKKAELKHFWFSTLLLFFCIDGLNPLWSPYLSSLIERDFLYLLAVLLVVSLFYTYASLQRWTPVTLYWDCGRFILLVNNCQISAQTLVVEEQLFPLHPLPLWGTETQNSFELGQDAAGLLPLPALTFPLLWWQHVSPRPSAFTVRVRVRHVGLPLLVEWNRGRDGCCMFIETYRTVHRNVVRLFLWKHTRWNIKRKVDTWSYQLFWYRVSVQDQGVRRRRIRNLGHRSTTLLHTLSITCSDGVNLQYSNFNKTTSTTWSWGNLIPVVGLFLRNIFRSYFLYNWQQSWVMVKEGGSLC